MPFRRIAGEPVHRERHRRRHHRHALAGDERKDRFGADIGRDDRRASRRQRAQHARTAERVIVRHRQHREEDRLRAEPGDAPALPAIVDVIVVGAGNELGNPGGPARQKHQCNVVGRRRQAIDLGVGDRARGRDVGKRQLAGPRLAGNDGQPQRGRPARSLRRHRPVVEIAQAIGREIGDGVGMLDEVDDLLLPVGRQRHDRDDADPRQCEEGDDEVEAVRKLQHDAIARAQTRRGETCRRAADTLAEFAIGHPRVPENESDLVRRVCDHAREHLPQGDVLPIALFAIEARKLLRPGCAAFEHAGAPLVVCASARDMSWSRLPGESVDGKIVQT